MNYGYGIWSEVFKEIVKNPELNIKANYQKYNQIKKHTQQGVVSKSDKLVFLRFSKGDQKLQDELYEKGFNLFPNQPFSKFIRLREEYLPIIDKQTNFPLKRVFVKEFSSEIYRIIQEEFDNKPVIIKIGNFHASEAKWLLNTGQQLPYIKYDLRKLPVLIEEFVPDARSIRIGLIGDYNDFNNYFITEHINDKTWLKNNAPEDELTYSYNERYNLGIDNIDELFQEVKIFAETYGANLLGIDWVISENKTGLLELNDMIGLPEGEFAKSLFIRELSNYLK